ncbi:MAG: DUF1465 family protein [Erythrobacter sp.]
MSRTTNLSRPIIEALYEEALVLADEVRSVFSLGYGGEAESGAAAVGNRSDVARPSLSASAAARLALSNEGLKTTTRMMHILAWLLNQRAFLAGELSEDQVLRHGTLPSDQPSDSHALASLEPETRELIAESERLHDRIARLDATWRDGLDSASPALALKQKLERSLRDFD